MNNIIIRKENKEDYKQTEHMTLRAFWNIHGPGCNEHLLVNKIRESEDYLPELSRVAEMDGKVVGAIFYTRAKVVDNDVEHEVLTFGPLCVEPTEFGKGIGTKLLEETMALAKEAGFSGIVIYGEPEYYPRHDFKTADVYGISDPNGNNFDALMAYQLNDSFEKVHGRLFESDVFEKCEDKDEIEEFNKEFPFYNKFDIGRWIHEERLGRISQVQKNLYTIKFFEKEISAVLKGAFYENEQCELPVVGDYVLFQENLNGNATITEVCNRKSVLKRPNQAKTGVDQYMVSNVDYLFIVSSLNDDFSANRIARYASVGLGGGAIPVAILTKSDLCSNVGRYVREVEAISEKIKVHAISAIYDIGLDELEEYLQPGNTICLIGSSGVGKSTLLNSILGEERMKTSQIREADSKGRHTTTHRELIELENGVTIIDTPGMREIGMADIEEGIDDTFSDIVELSLCCKFSDCKHDTEPGCAIKAAIENGGLSQERFDLFCSLHAENVKNYAKKKEVSKWVKQMKKSKKNI